MLNTTTVTEVYYLNVALALFNTGKPSFASVPVPLVNLYLQQWVRTICYIIHSLLNLNLVTPTYYVICELSS
jgi:hypothetical protein